MGRRKQERTGGGWLCDACNASFRDENVYNRHLSKCDRLAEHTNNKLRKASLYLPNLHGDHKRRRIDTGSSHRKRASSSKKVSLSSQLTGDFIQDELEIRSVHSKSNLGRTMGASLEVSTEGFDLNLHAEDLDSEDALVATSDSSHRSFASSVPPVPAAFSEPSGTIQPIPDPENHLLDDQQTTRRIIRPSAKVREGLDHGDDLPQGPGRLESPPPTSNRRVVLHVHEHARTEANKFGLRREYRRRPTTIPDADLSWQSLVSLPTDSLQTKVSRDLSDIIYPYPNVSSFLYNRFWKSANAKNSDSARDACLQDVLSHPLFNLDDARRGVNYKAIDAQLARDVQSPWKGTGWTSGTVIIDVPTGIRRTKAVRQAQANAVAAARRRGDEDPDADPVYRHKIPIYDVHYRDLTQLMVETFSSDANAQDFHYHGFEETWTPPYEGTNPERVYGEIYSSQAFLQAERELLASPPEPGCDLPRVIVPYMLWSDGTHLAQFGQAKAWPIYVLFGNLSKYARGQPSKRAAHYAAFLPTLPDSFADDLRARGVNPTADLLTHCKRELFHGTWQLMLDERFWHAYEHGVVVDCIDGIRRRLYPRIFTYSADYPEKVLVASMKEFGNHPCPRCYVPKSELELLGTVKDEYTRTQSVRCDDDAYRKLVSDARLAIYRDGMVVTSDALSKEFKDGSWIPTVNAFSTFSKHLSSTSLNIFDTLVVDQMHEFELGVWRGVLTHLVRMLHSRGQAIVDEFNRRFRDVAPFGSTIRRFAHNVSEMKKLAARDFEDILICCIPCFEGLFPDEFDGKIAELLYLMAYWHSLAKLRMHTDTTLNILEHATILLGKELRFFAEVVCIAIPAFETDSEYQARMRNTARKNLLQKVSTSDSARTAAPGSATRIATGAQTLGESTAPSTGGQGKRRKVFNLTTIKLHFLGDYVSSIRMFGTTDSYSTQIGELVHRQVKQHYARSNRRNFVGQIINLDTVQRVHDQMSSELEDFLAGDGAAPDGEESSPTSANTINSMHTRFRISSDKGKPIHLFSWLQSSSIRNDPAFENFDDKLKAHLLARYHNAVVVGDEPAYSAHELHEVHIDKHRIYEVMTATFNYTTYDVRREQDVIHTSLKSGPVLRNQAVMLRANEDTDATGEDKPHPFWYARVLGVYHANVYFYNDSKPTSMQFLFVRWFGRDPDWRGGPSTRALDRIGYISHNDESGAFGFLDPARVLRACHLIPAFAHGLTCDLLGESQMRDYPSRGDWTMYYVSRFVDRDMMMRYLGWGIGHRNGPDFPHEAMELLSTEEDRVRRRYDVPGGENASPIAQARTAMPYGPGMEMGDDGDVHEFSTDIDYIALDTDT